MVKTIDSEIICTAKSKKFGTIGYLVIDRLINGSSFGGIRIVSDISLSELQFVARSMTYKNTFIGNRIGGAKAVVIICKENEKYRRDILAEFGKCICPFIRNRIYFPVLDMGISLGELQTIFDGARCKQNVSSWKGLSHEYTAYSCFFSTLCVLEEKGISIKDVTFSVQGFGKVGSTYANIMCHAGAHLVALSNKYCGIIDDNGFNEDEIFREKLVKGDEFIVEQQLKDRQISHDSVLEKDVTILLPASNALVINEDNWKRISADIIICAANAPMSHEIERLLYKDGKIVITDFVANCGGVLGSIMDNYVDKNIILQILSTSYKRKVGNLLHRSIVSDRPFVDIILDDIEKKQYHENIVSNGKLIEYILSLYPIKKMARTYMSKKYVSMYETLWKIYDNYI